MESFPEEIQKYIKNKRIMDVSGHSFAKTYRIADEYFLKTDSKGELKQEAEMTAKFNDLNLAPRPVVYFSDEEKDYLITCRAEGEDLTKILDKKDTVIEVLNEACCRIRSLNGENIPLSIRYLRYREIYDSDMADLVYDDWCDLQLFHIGSKEEAYKIIRSNDFINCNEIIHGDMCLPNIMTKNGSFSSFVDLSTAGKGDSYIDLFLAAWSLSYNYKNEDIIHDFFRYYGKDKIDMDKLRLIQAYEMLA